MSLDELVKKVSDLFPEHEREIESEVSRAKSAPDPIELQTLEMMLKLLVDPRNKEENSRQLKRVGLRGLLAKSSAVQKGVWIKVLVAIVSLVLLVKLYVLFGQ